MRRAVRHGHVCAVRAADMCAVPGVADARTSVGLSGPVRRPD